MPVHTKAHRRTCPVPIFLHMPDTPYRYICEHINRFPRWLGGEKQVHHLLKQEMKETWVQSLGRDGPLEEEMATHSSILAWRIPWTEKPGGQQAMGSERVGHS